MGLAMTGLLVPSLAFGALPNGELPGARDSLERFAGEPGSGVPLEEQTQPTDPEALRAPLPTRPRDEAEAEGLETMEELTIRFRRGHKAAAHTVKQLMLIEAATGKAALDEFYGRQIRGRQAKVRKLRAQAIERYEDFLKLHPDHPTWSPEIMFRLAELHFESSSERLARQEEAFQKQLEAYQVELEKDPNAQPPDAPLPEYDRAIALYRGVATRFPNYHLTDASLYMMGTLLSDTEQPDQSRQAYLALACANRFEPPVADGSNLQDPLGMEEGYEGCQPWKDDSPYVAEAWLRVGEVHYAFDEFELALTAYDTVAEDPEGDLYDEALIRRAWTLYLLRRFPEAAETFDLFIRYADARRKEDKDTSGAFGLRDDAVKWLAKTYWEPDWNDDGRDDRLVGFDRLDADYAQRGEERHVPEIYAALGDLYAYETRFPEAIAIWKGTLNRWPLTPAAPAIQARILEAYSALQNKEGATQARDALATNYLRGTKWFYANESDPEVIDNALRLAEQALVATALDHHAKAQALRSSGDPRAQEEYEIAARAYAAFLERFPDAPSAYEYRYNLADTLYYSRQYADAAEQYAQVRDSNLDNRLLEDAANGVVLSLEAVVEEREKSGALALPEMPKKGTEGSLEEPKPIPDLLLALQDAYDRFVSVRPDSEAAPAMMYLAGSVSQRYHHFEEAEARFVQVIENYCEDNAAINAGTAILDGHVARGNLDKAREWTERLVKQGCGSGEEAAKFAGDLKTLGNAVRFQEATILYEAEEFEAAADRYVALVNEAPDDPNADRALNNAAVAYENIGRFNSASQTYKRIYTNYPDSEFADDALLRSGFNHSRFFEFDQAVDAYLILAEDDRYKDSQYRETALWNAADLLDNLQEYERSAKMYQRFATKSEDQKKAADAAFTAAEVLGKTTNGRATIQAYEQYLAQYGSDPTYDDKSVAAYLRIGQAYAELGDRKRAESYYDKTVAEFERRGLEPASDAADYPSEAQFLLAELALEEVLKTKVQGTGKKMENEVKKLTDALMAAKSEYEAVARYRRVEWSLAATYRIGFAFETWAINIRGAPVPKQLAEYSEAWFAYRDMVDQAASKFEETAIRLYEMTLAEAKKYRVSNEWTQSTRERLNIYKPDAYPLLRPPALELQLEGMP